MPYLYLIELIAHNGWPGEYIANLGHSLTQDGNGEKVGSYDALLEGGLQVSNLKHFILKPISGIYMKLDYKIEFVNV